MGTEPTTFDTSSNDDDSEEDQPTIMSDEISGIGSLLAISMSTSSEANNNTGEQPEDSEQEIQGEEESERQLESPTKDDVLPSEDENVQEETDSSSLLLQTLTEGAPQDLVGDTEMEELQEETDSSSLSMQEQQPNQEQPNDENKRTSLTTPTIPSKDDPNTFAACLQIMDDNHFLIEWLAYHYHVMPLRRLIVLVDPHSRSSPQPILDRWKDRIHITVWSDAQVYPSTGIHSGPTGSNVLYQHRHRQKQFVRRCLQKLHRTNRSWVFLVDTDEYVMINDRVRYSRDYLSQKELSTIPNQQEPGSVLKFLQMDGTINSHTNQGLSTIPCLTIARKTFGTKEASKKQPDVMGYNPQDFQTLHWQKYSLKPKPGKSILNLQYFPYKNINNNPSIHRPGSNSICKGKMWLPENLSVIVANHYPGTLEQMLFRKDDARGADRAFRNATKYRIQRFNEYKGLSKIKDSGTIKQWLPGFIASVGENEAKRLLQYAGRPKEASYLDAEALAAPPPPPSSSAADTQKVVKTATTTTPQQMNNLPLVQDNTALSSQPVSTEDHVDQSLSSVITSQDDEPDSFFAGCLLLMDDNHFLIEWIAYHYHVMPLRRLIVLTDPFSQTSPKHILERWKDRIHITLWNEHYIHPNGVPLPRNKHKKPTRVGQHRSRQRRFVKLCLQTLHKEEQDWVVLTDTDEYTMINNRLRNKKDKLSPLNYAAGKNLQIPSQRESGSVMKLLGMQDVVLKTGQHLHDNPCITMSRKTFGTRSMNATKEISGYQSSDFQTLQWRYYVDDGKPGKTIVNLAHVGYKDIPPYPSVHRPFTIGDICKGKIALKESMSPLVANHYPGTLQQMLFRTHDSRGNFTNATAYRVERFNNYTKLDKLIEKEFIWQWLPGFIESVGREEAERLLEFVGDPDLAAGPMNDNSTLLDPPVVNFGKPAIRKPKTVPITRAVPFTWAVPESRDLAEPQAVDSTNGLQLQAASREDPNSFASCLMVKGDDPRLIEWLAYHYHVLPLRRLILLSDPSAPPLSQELLGRWQDYMDIDHWNADYFDTSSIKGDKHKALQRMFIRRCLKKLIKEGKEWTLLTAVDEFTMINDRVRDSRKEISPLSQSGQHLPLPSPSAPGSVLQLLRREDVRIPHTNENAKDSPCITMSRKTFVGKEGPTPTSAVSGFDVSELETMRWRYFADEGKAGRSMLNLSKIKIDNISLNPSPNRPLHLICQGTLRLVEEKSIFVVNRYTRSPEDLKNLKVEKETIQAWLPGFVASVGEGTAKELLAPMESAAAASA